MKSFFYLSALCLSLALTACSDDDSSQDTPEAVKDGTKLSATLPSQPAAQWLAGDEVRVLSLASITPNRYTASQASSGATAVLELTEGKADLVNQDGALNAYTPNPNIKAIWSTDDAQAVVGQRIPHAYAAAEVGIRDKQVPRPVLLWAPVIFDNNGQMHAELRHLTALLNIPSSSVPQEAHALLLVTRRIFTLNEEDIRGGNGEAVSGHFQAILTGSPVLAPGEDDATCDTLRINLDRQTNYDSYCIPIIAGKYSNLHVLAVTDDSLYPYEWYGTSLLQFTDKTFTAGVVY